MSLQNRNTAWVHAIIDELSRAGVRQAVVCAGGRSFALIAGIAASDWEIAHVQTDERAAGFLALGLAKATQRPVVVAVTSGSSVGNLLPALIEADSTDVPVIVLTADRPKGGQKSGMPQTTNQIGLCAAVVRAALDLDNPTDSSQDIEALRGQIAGLLPYLIGDRKGPVQINIPMAGKLSSADPTPNWEPPALSDLARHGRFNATGTPLPIRDVAITQPHATDWDGLIARLGLRPGMKGLVVAASDCPLTPSAAAKLSKQLGFPLLADALSGLRRPGMPNLLTTADILVAVEKEQPDLVIRLGGLPVSQYMQNWLSTLSAPVLRIDRKHIEADFLTPRFELLQNPDEADLERLAASLGRGDENWLEQWVSRDAVVRNGLNEALAALPWGECQAVATVLAADGYELLHVANSMTTRHTNLLLEAHDLQVYSNRGVVGIDGTNSTFIGELHGSQSRGLLLIGDQTFLHDLSGLEASRIAGLRGTICVTNNSGASLFDVLGLGLEKTLPDYTRLVRNPPGYRIGPAAAAFGLQHVRCESLQALQQALADAKSAEGLQVIEMVVPADSLRRDIVPLYTAAMSALQVPVAAV
ncbi:MULTISPECIES: 2-succinyl-5-enolpyruvyl-6-hydroxy-3-cyclohexene-1-carboxylic-acid synthase [Paraburkholderia]|uniref:2-succinyl-5-enolpyruvyl-6-hydroxy-3- cyclohexene-1-carboxylic-acid synthase n=1 Tax=Paraburkholderia TaxID=1822464 RepID=UPI0022563F62|nr:MULTISPECIES: 2-succinyl-5-enolpyruvyl-6-hydroxy-3-cyclohexene-1-carboxylic-acid synthase [Paraburkholderia]MCX4162926.1 2-succinyl-5-enolpyruvyl-6-hydroxy-3-cyclohexene-1-carboxylic-acid synthase [Paraburkholderia megapolitana]MDN7158422.1 2-succinyl-5-enolpyruvyl-6-hydroxy-3-cyclohexene-1-carboxylic-acid synthase [Paraburkholderia sp. CHISQ3]MDQ6495469.1 2-succinyl-5-enolpyruvyl-6-hydroxy-3-cyclohexene-1-carboxylic-acid synthase [Paraburkholderia megapolitana]